MEREEEKTTIIKPKQFGSFLLLISAIVIFTIVIVNIVHFTNRYFYLKELEKQEKELIAKIENLDDLYSDLQDEDFYTLYILEYYYK